MATVHPIKPFQKPDASTELNKFIFATGCPHSGWDKALSILINAGTCDDIPALSNWYDEEFNNSDRPYSFHNVLPTLPLAKKLSSIACNSKNPLLLADSRTTYFLDYWCNQFPSAIFLLFYNRAEISLANALESGVNNPFEYMNQWKLSHQYFLKFAKNNPKRVLIINTEAAIHHPKKFVKACNKYSLNLKLPNNSEDIFFKMPSEFHRWLSVHIIKSLPSIKKLKYKLRSKEVYLGSIPESKIEFTNIIISFLKYHKNLEISAKNTEAKSNQLYEEYSSLFAKIDLLEKEATGFSAEEKRITDDFILSQKENNNLKLHIKELENIEIATKRENHNLLIELHNVQEELEVCFLKNNKLETQYFYLLQKYNSNREISTLSELTKAVFQIYATYFSRRTINKQIKIIKDSNLFNESWYLSQYPDVAEKYINPIEHYIRHGTSEGRDPSIHFNTIHYLESHPEIKKNNINPLIHYILYNK